MNAAYIESMMRKVLITGAAGFIGSCLSEHLFRQGYDVVGCDIYNFRNQFFDVGDSHHLRLQKLRYDRIAHFLKKNQIEYHSIDLSDHDAVLRLFKQVQPEVVVHLAAQAGVRHSVKAPMDFVKSNLNGFANVLEACKQFQVEEFLYASSSSVYGARTDAPFNETDRCETPESFYAATKKANELMAHSYAHMFGLPSTGLRFFTVYGPWGRPDMAMWLFADAILKGEPITLFNHGKMRRDFTYVDDIVESIERLVPTIAQPAPDWNGAHPDPASSMAPHRLYNIGNNSPVELMHLVETMENALGMKAKKILAPIETGDVPETYADVDALTEAVNFRPATPLAVGVGRFIDWYRAYTNR